MRIAVYWIVGAGLGWWQRGFLLDVLRWPAEVGAAAAGIPDLKFRIFDPLGGIMLAVSTASVAGFIFASPLILMELWLFIRPALNPDERRWFVTFIPGATGLFLAGIAFAYWLMVWAFMFFFRMNESLGAEGELTLNTYVSFMLKVLPTTGLVFELPVVLMFLAYVGLVRSQMLVKYWRHITVGIIIVVAVVEPTNNPITTFMFILPVLFLFYLSIGMIKWVERNKDRAQQAAEPEEAEWAEPAPALANPAPELRPVEVSVPAATAPAFASSAFPEPLDEPREAEAFAYYERQPEEEGTPKGGPGEQD